MARKKKVSAKKTKKEKEPVMWELFFDSLILNADFPVMTINGSGKIVFINKRYADFLGYSLRGVKGKNWINSIVPEARRREVRKIYNSIKNDGKCCYRFDLPVLTKKGNRKYVCWTVVPLLGKDRSLSMFVGLNIKEPIGIGIERSAKIKTIPIDKSRTVHSRIIEMFFSATQITEPDTAEHALRVTSLAVALARRLKMSKERINRLKTAALLHDLGKLAIDEKILYKKGKLKEFEYEAVKKHSNHGAQMIYPVYFLRDIIPIMKSHHEYYDGTGYPDGLKGDGIPLESRILSIADIYEALTADRPYRMAYDKKRALSILKKEKGHKLDPELTDIFIRMVEDERFKEGGFE